MVEQASCLFISETRFFEKTGFLDGPRTGKMPVLQMVKEKIDETQTIYCFKRL